jgi:hypothetical protein
MIGEIFGKWKVISKVPQRFTTQCKWGSIYIVRDEDGNETKKKWRELQDLKENDECIDRDSLR